MAIYEKLLVRFPDSPIVLNNLAFLYAESASDKKTLARALELVNKAQGKLDSSPPMLMDTLAWIYYKSGDTVKAVETINQAIAKAPDNPTLLYHQAVILKEAGRDKEALKSVEKALEYQRAFPERKKARELKQILAQSV